MKKLLTLGLLVASVAVIAGCSKSETTTDEAVAPATPEVVAPATPEVAAPAVEATGTTGAEAIAPAAVVSTGK